MVPNLVLAQPLTDHFTATDVLGSFAREGPEGTDRLQCHVRSSARRMFLEFELEIRNIEEYLCVF